MAASPPGWQAMEMAAAPTGPKGDVRVGATSVVGATVPDVDRVLAGMRPGFRACYNKGLAADPTMSGKLVLSIKVAANGDIDAVTKASGSGLSSEVESCMIARAKRATFSAPTSGGATVQVPIDCVVQQP
jgi:hypothetical protein